jgi:hypothetical protein
MDERNEVGTRLEEVGEKLFAAYGYRNVVRAQEMHGTSDAKHEVDVYGEEFARRRFFGSRRSTVAAECKYKSGDQKVEKKEVSDFVVKCHDLGIDTAYFITNSEFTDDAANLAKHYNIRTIDGRSLNLECRKHGIDYYARMHHLKIRTDGPVADAARTLVDLLDESGILKGLFGN